MARVFVLYSFEPHRGIIQGLLDEGHEVQEKYYGIESHRMNRTFFIRFLQKFFGTQKILKYKFNQAFNKVLDKSEDDDYILLIKPKTPSKKILAKLENLSTIPKIILWTTDSIKRFPEQVILKKYAHSMFFQDGADIIGHEDAKWLPLGYDSKMFRYQGQKKEIDILLVGNCQEPFYSSRLKYFVEASKLAKIGYNVTFIGSNLLGPQFKVLRQNGVDLKKRVSLKKLAFYIKKAKTCINIHQDDGRKPINPLFFAIPSCGTIQITDIREYYSDWLVLGKDFHPIDLKNLNKLLIKTIRRVNTVPININELNFSRVHTFREVAREIILE